jgi:NADH:ubiquinone oxidoreductase subunit E
MGLPISQVYDVITFYSAINEKPRGKYDIQVCNSIVCKVNNNAFLIKTLESLLNIKAGEVTPDQKFSITLTQCIGQCDKAPALRINQQVYGHLDSEEKIKQLISSLE